jgi:glycosyltransferase involved in cell wall biosynthesis
MDLIKPSAVDDIEALILKGDHRKAFNLLIQVLVHVERLKGFSTVFVTDAEEPFISALYTRLANSLQQLFLNEKLLFNDNDFVNLVLLTRAIATVFEVSGFYTVNHLLQYFRSKLGDLDRGPFVMTLKNKNFLMRYIICTGFSHTEKVDYELLFRLSPEMTLPVILALLSYNVALTPHTFERREQLIDLKNFPNHIFVPEIFIDLMAASYMMCSYAVRRDKHVIKKEINKIICRSLAHYHITPPTFSLPRKTREKPVIVVICEVFDSNHAMFRCFSTAIKELRAHFHLVGAFFAHAVDEEAKQLFHEHIEVFSETEQSGIRDLSRLVEKIKIAKPDIVYFPSIGMRGIGVMLSNLRLAPIQMLTMGSPATTYSDAMDYVFMEEDNACRAADLCSERMILLPPDTFKLLPIYAAPDMQPIFRDNPPSIRIAIPAKIYKLNPEVFAVCKAIRSASTRPVTFCFFPNEPASYFLQAKREIFRLLPGSEVYPTTDAKLYLQNLQSCDIYMATFPFSGANSFVDAACLGMPTVTHQNEELHGIFEEVMLKRLGMPDWLVAPNKQAYVDAVLRLVNSDEERRTIGQQLRDKMQWFLDLMKGNVEVSDQNFAEAVFQIYEKHERLQESPERIWNLPQLKNF